MSDDTVDSIDLLPWSWQTPEGFVLRGWRSPASGKPVLHFIHGTGMCGLTYWPVLEPLLPQVDLFISDLHGHGDSDGQAPFVGWNRSVSWRWRRGRRMRRTMARWRPLLPVTAWVQ